MADNNQDVAQAWKGFDETRRKTLLRKMSPEQKKKLRTALEGNPATPDISSFTDNPKGEGLYRMLPSSMQGYTDTSQEISVPYSRVKEAQGSGLRLHPDEEPRFQKDSTHEGQGPSLFERAGSAIQSALEPSTGIAGQIPIVPGFDVNAAKASGRTVAAAPGYLIDLATALFHGFQGKDPHAQEILPLIDPMQMPEGMYKQFVQDWKKDPKLAIDNLIGTLVGMGLVAAATHGATKATEVVSKIPAVKNMGENVRGFVREQIEMPQRIERTVEKFGNESERVRQQHQAAEEKTELERGRVDLKNLEEKGKAEEKAAKTEQERAEIKKKNDAVLRDEKKRLETKHKLHNASEWLKQKIDAAKKKAKEANDAAWDAWRNKVAGKEISSDPIVNEINNVKSRMNPEDVAEFRKILKESRPDLVDMSEAEKLQTEIMQGQFPGKEWRQLSETERNHVRRIVESNGLDPDSVGAQGSNKPISADRLHVWKTQLEYAIRSATRENVRGGIGQVLDKVRQAEVDLSKAAGAEGELAKARALHGPFVETFRNSPNTPATVASYVSSKVTPEFTKDARLEQYIGMLAKYDPSIPQIISHIDDLQAGLKALPKGGPLRDKLTVPPPDPRGPFKPPVKKHPYGEPEPKETLPDVTKINEENIKFLNDALRRYGKIGPWVFRLLTGGLFEHLFKGESSTFGGTLMIGQGALVLMTKILRGPGALEWLARPSADDIKVIESLPPKDAARLKQAFKALADEEIRQNPEKSKIKISPVVAAWLAGGSAKEPKKGEKANPADLKKQAEDLQHKFHQSGMAPESSLPSQQAAPAQPTHEYDPSSGGLVPIQ